MNRKPFSLWATAASLAVAFGSFYLHIFVRQQVGTRTILSSDAVLAIALALEALGLFAAGLLAAWLARSWAWREQLVAALLLGVCVFLALKQIKPPSFSYDRLYASRDELVVWALVTAAAAWLLGLWGASLSLLSGASGGRAELRWSFEVEIARTHLRLNRRTLLLALAVGSVFPAGFMIAGVGANLGRHEAVPRAILVLFALCILNLLAWAIYAAARWAQRRKLPLRKKRPASVVMTAISIAGVAVGVWALTVVLSVMSGFEVDLKSKMIGTNAHAMLQTYRPPFEDWRGVLSQVRKMPRVLGASPFTFAEAMVSQGESLAGAEVKGIEVASVGAVSELPKQVKVGKLEWLNHPEQIPLDPPPPGDALEQIPDGESYIDDTYQRRHRMTDQLRDASTRQTLLKMPGICLGIEMAHNLQAWVGDVVHVINPLGDMGPTGPIPRSQSFRVACVLYAGMYEFDAKFAYLSIPEAQRFFRMGAGVSGLELKFADPAEARGESLRVVGALGGPPYLAKTWQDLNRNLFSALKMEKGAMLIILTFIVMVACFNILSTLIMLVLEKTKEIAILKSMGARNASMMKIFVLEGLIIGSMGTVIGLFTGLASCSFIERFGIQLAPDVYYITNLPVRVEPAQFAVVAAIAVCLSYLATLYPAWTASQLSPVDGLREE